MKVLDLRQTKQSMTSFAQATGGGSVLIYICYYPMTKFEPVAGRSAVCNPLVAADVISDLLS